jgi:N-acetylneuraminate synthase
MRYHKEFQIGNRMIAIDTPTYFIADIAANHEGDLDRALSLIEQAKAAGADCAKFQHFTAKTIVSDKGFGAMTNNLSHQSSWEKSVSEVYDQYHTHEEWDEALYEKCLEVGIDFLTTPYNTEVVNRMNKYMPAYKIGSGDITNIDILTSTASTGKPIFLASGASSLEDVQKAVTICLAQNPNICLMQCNTNYTASLENFAYVNLNVLKSFAMMYPGMPLGFSDHTPGHSAVLGAITLGARVVEKHFTDDNARIGPDHKFALNPTTWNAMVTASRELELALGNGIKKVEDNEVETVIIQRRSCRLIRDVKAGELIHRKDIEYLRPCEIGAITPMDFDKFPRMIIKRDKKLGESIRWADFE